MRLLPLILAIVLAGCSVFLPRVPAAKNPGGGPPPVTIGTADGPVELSAWTYCYGTMCVDGSPPRTPVDVGAVEQVPFAFPVDGWTFSAEFVPVGHECPRRQSVPVVQVDATNFVVEPAGPAGVYDVTLVGKGQGDLFVTFRWHTPTDGPMTAPSARLAVLADHDGRVDSYGVELQLSNIAGTPEVGAAEITVTAANGRSHSFAPVLAMGCPGDGTIYWDGPDAEGLVAAQLGPGPFQYEVTLSLDDVRYTASATWPQDVIEGNEPSVALEFEPALPALE